MNNREGQIWTDSDGTVFIITASNIDKTPRRTTHTVAIISCQNNDRKKFVFKKFEYNNWNFDQHPEMNAEWRRIL